MEDVFFLCPLNQGFESIFKIKIKCQKEIIFKITLTKKNY